MDSVNSDQVKQLLANNGISDLDQLSRLISSSSLDHPDIPSISPVADSWVIKAWKLDDRLEGETDGGADGSSEIPEDFQGFVTPEEVRAILAKYGIDDIDQLAQSIAISSQDSPQNPLVNPLADSYVIKAWKLDDSLEFNEIPESLVGGI